MFIENDLSNGFVRETENSQNVEKTDRKFGFYEKGTYFDRESEKGRDGFCIKASKVGNLGSQELTLSYLCDNSKVDFQEKEISGKNLLSSLEKNRYDKGKEVVSDSGNENERWVERDFFQLNGINGGSSKRGVHGDEGIEIEKKPKIDTLNLSLSLPDVSLSLTPSNPLPKANPPPVVPKPSRSTHSLAPSNNNTRTGSSDDFTAASLSYSYSHPFSHNPSCSLTRNSTENYEFSIGSYRRETDPIWNCGEGTNGSVHSRFKPVGDGVVAFGHPLTQGNWPINKDSCNSFCRTTGSENHSFLPSELPAKPRKDTRSVDSRGRASNQQTGFGNSDGGKAHKLTRPERLLREVVSESVPVMAQIFQELPDDTIESTKEFLKNLIVVPEKSEGLAGLQNRLERRSDLTLEALSKSHEAQLDILVAVKTGVASYLSEKNRLPMAELAEVFLLLRCRNVNCKSLLPVDDCDCKICSSKKGFCSSCMCPVCLNFDCASNTCSWVGCDVCSHWCHAVCGIQKNLIKPGPSLRGSTGTKEMQFHCLGCGHASEMFGFVKDVFVCCAKDWDLKTLIKELDCVRKIFRGSEDARGKELQGKAEEMLSKLENNIISPPDACNGILQYLKYGISEFSGSGSSSKDLLAAQINQRGGVVSVPPSLPPKSTPYNTSSSTIKRDMLSLRDDTHEIDLKALMSDPGFDSLESIVRVKEAEARMFQSRADDARREAEEYRKMAHARSEKLEEEYTSKLDKLCLQETEERRRKKFEELKVLENSHCDYYHMKIRMQAEIAGLLERMEVTKKQWV